MFVKAMVRLLATQVYCFQHNNHIQVKALCDRIHRWTCCDSV